MSEKTDTAIALLKDFGLSEEEGRVYLEIATGRGDTALTLSRSLGLARTKVYRLLDNLIVKKFVVTRLGDRGTHFVATSGAELSYLVDDRARAVERLRRSLPVLQKELSELSLRGDSPKSEVRYHHGLDGLKQVTYNSLQAKGELLTYEMTTLNAFMDKAEAEKLRQRFVENKIHIRTLTNTTHLAPWTDVAKMVESYWDIRYLDPRDSPFQFEILIYNDVYCMYRYTGEDVFCVEIHSSELASMQRQLFEYLWSGAKRFKILNSHGEATIA